MDVRSLLLIVAALILLWLLRAWLRRNMLAKASIYHDRIKSKLTTPPLPDRNGLSMPVGVSTHLSANERMHAGDRSSKLAFEVAAHLPDKTDENRTTESSPQAATGKNNTVWPSLHESSQAHKQSDGSNAAGTDKVQISAASYRSGLRNDSRVFYGSAERAEDHPPRPDYAATVHSNDDIPEPLLPASQEKAQSVGVRSEKTVESPDFLNDGADASANDRSGDDHIQPLQTKLNELEALIEVRDQQLQRQKHAFQALEKVKKQLFERNRENEQLQQSNLKAEGSIEAFRRGAQKAAMLEQQLAANSASTIAVEERDATIKRLSEALEVAETDAKNAQHNDLELRRLRSELVNLEVKNTLSSNRVRDMESRIKAQQRALSDSLNNQPRESAGQGRADGLFHSGIQRKEPVAAYHVTLFDPLPEEDDLKKIKGIGPIMEGLLNELGINSFKQLSQLSPQDIAQVTIALDAFPGRIERDDWLGQAAVCQREKYGETM